MFQPLRRLGRITGQDLPGYSAFKAGLRDLLMLIHFKPARSLEVVWAHTPHTHTHTHFQVLFQDELNILELNPCITN